ncbi:hypothetical protein H0W80_01070 [Candidatus Saccharibacteria bacterium]|nr:hypothetical protein [Candidatus Saccharibacteria bacterium]
MMNELLPKPDLTKIAPLKLTKKQLKYVMSYYDPNSETFGNGYESGRAAGFAKVYSAQLASPARNVQWVMEARKRMTHYSPDHIYQALQDVAQNAAPREKLKALELMGKAKGMFIDRSQQDVHVTFTNDVPRPSTESIIDVEPTNA